MQSNQSHDMDITKFTDQITICLLSITGIQLLHDASFQEWTKIFLQAVVAAVTIYTLLKNSKKGFKKDKN